MLRDPDFFWTMRWIRADAMGVLAATLWAVTVTHGSWAWFFALLLVPDLSMAGYLFGSRAGAAVYNTGHMYAWPLALLAIGLTGKSPLTTTAGLSWITHIAVDQVVGYGLKLPTMFEHTSSAPSGERVEIDRWLSALQPQRIGARGVAGLGLVCIRFVSV